MPSKKKRNQTPRWTCCVCGKPMGQVIPWTGVTITGELIRWHPVCHQTMKQREAS